MAEVRPPRDVRAWLGILRPERHGCLHSVPDPRIPGDVAAYNQASRQIAAEPDPQPGVTDRIAASLFPALYPGHSEAEAEIWA